MTDSASEKHSPSAPVSTAGLPPRSRLPHLDEAGKPSGIAFGEWLGDRMYEGMVWVWRALCASFVGQALRRSPTIMYLYGFCVNYIWGACCQKLEMMNLEEVDFVGGPARDLTVIITGPTSGIGLETVRALARRGARLVLACRNTTKGEELKKTLEADCSKLGRKAPDVEVRKLDLSSLRSVREFAAAWEATGREVHVLINNAGIFNMGVGHSLTEDKLEAHLASNHLGHFLLTLLMVPALNRGAKTMPEFSDGCARVVHVASSMHLLATEGMRVTDPNLNKGKYSSEFAYAQSKLAQIMFAREMRRRLGPEPKIQVFAVHPGMVLTDVVRTLPGPMISAYKAIMGLILLTPSQGARASVYCATSKDAPLEGWKTFGYFDASCKPILPSGPAQDVVQGIWLWRWSAEQVALPVENDIPEPST